MKRNIEIPQDLDSKIQALRESWNGIGANSSYGEVVRVLLTLGLHEMEKAGKLPRPQVLTTK
ncbi:MAG: hypothetical protein IJK52_13575 [Oscillospiraceae bacterium]|nr:hypothetical protein [Oscillospiraceae bacterium]